MEWRPVIPEVPTSLFCQIQFSFLYQLQTLKETLIYAQICQNAFPFGDMFKLEGFLNFQKPFPKSTERKPESHSIWLCRRAAGCLYGGYWTVISLALLGERVEGGMWWKSFGPTKKGYLGLGDCVFLYVCVREINISLKSWESKMEKHWHKERKRLREQKRKRKLTCFRFVCDLFLLPYPFHWTASYFLQEAGLFLSRTSACTLSQTLPVHFGWKKNTHADC